MVVNLQKVVCIVIGGVLGLGWVIVQRFVKYGVKVVVVDFFLSDGEKVVKELGESCYFVLMDVSLYQNVL